VPAFYLTLIAVLLAGLGARDQVTIAGLSERQGRRPGVLLVGLAGATATALAAGWAAGLMLQSLPAPARGIFAAIALGMAGLESLVLVPRRKPDEPTHSLGALLFVLAVNQATDAARFLIFGLGVGLAAPTMAAAAGVLGGGLLIALAWARADLLASPAARWSRRLVGALLTVTALVLFLREIGIV